MNLLIGENIRRLRRQRDLTQEEVAAHLGISPQSISKWERADGYPDITMLPSLANYFGVSVDELIGMGEIAKSQKYTEFNRLWRENNEKNKHHENVLLMRKALKLFPNNAILLVQLSTSLEKLDGTEEEKAHNLRESIALQEQILRYGEDSETRGATLFNICFAYWKNGEREKALEYAGKLPNLYKARENALIHFLEGEEKREVAKNALVPLALSITQHLSVLAQTEENPVYYEKAEQILKLLFDGGEDDTIELVLKDLRERRKSGERAEGKSKAGERTEGKSKAGERAEGKSKAGERTEGGKVEPGERTEGGKVEPGKRAEGGKGEPEEGTEGGKEKPGKTRKTEGEKKSEWKERRE